MKNIKDVVVILQARLNSQRVPNKMLRPFGSLNLFEIALRKLIHSDIIPKDHIYVSVYEDELKSIAMKYNVQIFHRSEESAHNDNSLQKIYEWHNKLPFKYVVKVNGCAPLLKVETIDMFISQFLRQEEDNLFGVIPIKDYFWNKEGKLVTPWPDNQTIMNTKAVEITYKAAHVLYASPLELISQDKFMGDFNKTGGIKLYPMDELECFDIDYEWQFTVGEILYTKFPSTRLT